ncbi:DUF6192 family protein [Actinomadura madurae]|nr:DUF6192 family protein [Actinomadura madurae]MCP9976856.1 DUF6192 family protein [Actinomadura madurae]MCQ0011652.1 DUF6192 family protein [Actinomadura madurae]MCQ0013041.1 DUF6192 family protein [Actinomadura madurae]
MAAAGRLVPARQGHRFTDAERERVHANLLRVRRSADWIATPARRLSHPSLRMI